MLVTLILTNFEPNRKIPRTISISRNSRDSTLSRTNNSNIFGLKIDTDLSWQCKKYIVEQLLCLLVITAYFSVRMQAERFRKRDHWQMPYELNLSVIAHVIGRVVAWQWAKLVFIALNYFGAVVNVQQRVYQASIMKIGDASTIIALACHIGQCVQWQMVIFIYIKL